MKKNIYILMRGLAAFVLTLGMAACNDNDYEGLENSGEAKLLTFTAGGKLENLDEASDYIHLIFSAGTDLTTLAPSFTLSEGAKIQRPESPNGPIDLSATTTYTVINGNLYHDYKVLAQHVGDVTYFSDFSIGIYKGNIDNEARTIVVKYPIGSDVTGLSPKFELSEGAKLVSPSGITQDFTNPVKYTIEYLDEQFTYTVSVELVEFRKIAFLGSPLTAEEITNPDDKTAYEWFVNSFPLTEYVSFKDIKGGKALDEFAVIWYAYDGYDKGGDPVTVSDINSVVVEALNNYLNQGGGLYLSSAAMAIGNLLDIAKDGKMWNNAWGYDSDPFLVNDGNGIGWGMRVKNPSHPIFKGMQWNTGETHRFFLLSNGCNTKGHNIRWNFFANWDGNVYNGNVERWEATNGGKQLASLHWDDNMDQVSILTEYPGTDGKGTVITNGAECYDWYQEGDSPENKFRKNVETLTYNILNYLAD